jgi:hypothetical protein
MMSFVHGGTRIPIPHIISPWNRKPHTYKIWSWHEAPVFNLSEKWLNTRLCLTLLFFLSKQKLLWHGMADTQTDSFNRTAQFLNDKSPCAAVPTDQNTGAEWQCNKTCEHQQRWNIRLNEDTLLFQVDSSAPKVSSYNEITCEFT